MCSSDLPAAAPWWTLVAVVLAGIVLLSLLDFARDCWAYISIGYLRPGDGIVPGRRGGEPHRRRLTEEGIVVAGQRHPHLANDAAGLVRRSCRFRHSRTPGVRAG